MRALAAVFSTTDETKRTRIAFGTLLLLYIVSRTVALTRLPVFIDEAIHILWAREFQQGAIAAGFGDGKWLSIVLFSLITRIPGDVLWLTRFVGVCSGLVTLTLIYLTGRQLLSKRASLLSSLIFIFLPFSLFYTRLALADTLLLSFGALVLYASVKTVKTRRGNYSVILAVLLMVSILIKFAGVIFLMFPPLAVVLLMSGSTRMKGFKLIIPSLLAGFAILVVVYIVGFPPDVTRRSSELAPMQILKTLGANIRSVSGWYWDLLTPPIFITTSLALIWSLAKARERETSFLLSLIFINAFPFILVGQGWYPRYLIFTLVPLSLLLGAFVSWTIDQISAVLITRTFSHLVYTTLLFIILVWPVAIDTWLIADPETVSLPDVIDWQFRSGWPSGYGTKDLAEFLQDSPFQQPPYLMRPIFWSHVKQGGLEVHLDENTIVELAEFGQDLPVELTEAAKQLTSGRPVLIAIDTTHKESVALFSLLQQQIEAELLWSFPKPGATGGLELWQIHDIPSYSASGTILSLEKGRVYSLSNHLI